VNGPRERLLIARGSRGAVRYGDSANNSASIASTRSRTSSGAASGGRARDLVEAPARLLVATRRILVGQRLVERGRVEPLRASEVMDDAA